MLSIRGEVVYVVTCYMEGCEECGNSYHVVGVFTDKKEAYEAAKDHEKNKENHLHFFLASVETHTIQE
jgi:hypothetical protein